MHITTVVSPAEFQLLPFPLPSVANQHHVDADPDTVCHPVDLDPTFYFDADPDPSFPIKAQHLENVLKQAHIQYILACHLQIDADPGSNLSL